MSEVIKRSTTTYQRDIAAGGLAMLVLAAAAAGSANAEELDSELLRAAADFQRLRAEDARDSELMEAADHADRSLPNHWIGFSL
jgi:hypothetical protein